MKYETKGRWRDLLKGNVLAMGLVSFFTDFSSEMVYPFFPALLAGLVAPALVPVYLGLLEGLAESTSSLLKLVSGKLSDLFHRRKLWILAGYGISTLLRPFNALAVSAWQVVALRFGDRVGKGIRTSPRDALLSESVPAYLRGRAFGFHRAMDHAGAVLGPLAALAILAGFSGISMWQGADRSTTPSEMTALRWLFAASVLPGIAAVAAILWGIRDLSPKTTAAAPGGDAESNKRLPRRFFAFLAAVVIFTLGNSSDLFLVFYAKEILGFGLAGLVGLWVLLHLAKTAFSLPGGWLSDRYGRRPAIITGWLIYAAVYFTLPSVTGAVPFLLLLCLYGAYYGASEGAEKALVADLVPAERRGTAYGYYHMAVGVAALPASLLFGVFWARLGPGVAFPLAGGLALLASLTAAAVLRRT